MMNAEFYNLTQQTQAQLYYAMRAAQAELAADQPPLPPLLQIRAGYAESPAWFMVQAAEFDPEPLTVENLRVRDIYASERIVQALLELLAGEKWLDRVGNAYHLTTAGQEQIKQLRERGAKFMAPVELPWPLEKINQLEASLHDIIERSLKYTDKPGIWCLAHSRNRAPAPDSPPLLKINQYFSDFNAFRDDAHMAAWQSYEVEGYTWEAFAFICSGQAASAETVFDQLAFRGFSRDDYAEALQALTARNWLEPSPDAPDTYAVTETGRAIHEQVESLTDQYFYAPWAELGEDEVAETLALLQQFHDRLQALAKT